MDYTVAKNQPYPLILPNTWKLGHNHKVLFQTISGKNNPSIPNCQPFRSLKLPKKESFWESLILLIYARLKLFAIMVKHGRKRIGLGGIRKLKNRFNSYICKKSNITDMNGLIITKQTRQI